MSGVPISEKNPFFYVQCRWCRGSQNEVLNKAKMCGFSRKIEVENCEVKFGDVELLIS